MQADLPDIESASWRPLSRFDAVLCADLWNRCFEADGGYRMVESEWVDELEDPEDDPAQDGIIAVHDDGFAMAIGFVQIPPATSLWRASGWGAVHPECRNQGIGTAVLGWRERRGAARLLAENDDIPRFHWQQQYDFQASPIKLLDDSGYRPVRHWFEMSRDLSDSITVKEVADIRVVEYRSELSPAVRHAHNDAFRDHWGSQPVTKDRWDRYYAGGEFFRSDLSIVATSTTESPNERVGEIAAYLNAACYPHDYEDRGRTEVWAETIGTRRQYRGMGVASAVISAFLAKAAAAGFEYATLGVDSSSPTGALGLYERHGFVVDRASTSYGKPIEGTTWDDLPTN